MPDCSSMDATASNLNSRRTRLLVAIASYGEKNIHFLKQIIRNYQNLAMDVDVVVVSEAPKDVGPTVRVVVGLPSSNPWSLPFAHKAIFAENVDRYDLFVYSEDDMEVREGQIQAFLQVSPVLAADEIAGFLRYETDRAGNRYVPEAHESAHWKPETVKRRGEHTVAEFSNEHAGFYILTRTQLKQVLASGNFLRGPYEGRYGLPETAATDPYTCCGFRKVICISALDDFLIHHMPNRYIGQLGTPLSDIREQVQTLVEISHGRHPASRLCQVDSKVMRGRWSKSYNEQPCDEILAMLPAATKSVLSVGCGWGAVETHLVQRGMAVTALPLDSVVGASTARRGIEVVYGSLEEGMKRLAGRRFDYVLVTNLLHLQPDSALFLEACAARVAEGGTFIVAGPNFDRIPNLLKRTFGANGHRRLRNFDESGINVSGPRIWATQIQKYGLGSISIQWFNHELSSGRLGSLKLPLASLTARDWVLRARRKPDLSNHRSV